MQRVKSVLSQIFEAEKLTTCGFLACFNPNNVLFWCLPTKKYKLANETCHIQESKSNETSIQTMIINNDLFLNENEQVSLALMAILFYFLLFSC